MKSDPETRERTILRPGETGPGVLARTSVSQINEFDHDQDGGCPTKWWLNKIEGRPGKPPSPGQEIGSQGHREIEHLLKTGEDVLGTFARRGKHLLPTPGPDLKVEHEFKGSDLVAAGVPLLGYIDVTHARGTYVDPQGVLQQDPAGTAEVMDHKFTKSISLYAKAGSALIRTVQMPAYGMYAAKLFPGIERVRFTHNNFQTTALTKDQRESGQELAEKRTALVPLTMIRDRWVSIEATVREMKDVALEADEKKVPKNLNACKAFGGCPYTEFCTRPREAVLASIFGKGNAMSLLDKLRKPAVAPVPEVPTPAAPAPVISKPAGGALARAAKLKAELAEAERLAALEEGFEEPVTEANENMASDAEAALAEEDVTLASEAIKNATYEGRFEDGSTFRVMFVGKLKAGLTFRRLDKEGTCIFPADTGLVLVSVPPVSAPVPTGVTPPDMPKPGQSGPTFTPIDPGTPGVPANVMAAQAAALPPAVREMTAAEQHRENSMEGFQSAPVGRFKRTKAEIAAGLTVEQAKAARAASPAAGLRAEVAESTSSVIDASEIVGPIPKSVLTQGVEDSSPRTGTVVHSALAPPPAPVFVLYIDCLPTKGGNAQSLEELTTSACDALCSQFDAADVRCGKPDSPLGFGKWKGALAALVKANAPTSGEWFILGTKSSEIAAVVAEAMASRPGVKVISVVG